MPELEHKAGGPGSLSVLHGEDLGIQSYGSGMFTADKTIAERPDLVRRFVAAYMKGYADVIQDPGAAADSLIRNNPEYKGKKEMLVAQLQADLDYTSSAPIPASTGWAGSIRRSGGPPPR